MTLEVSELEATYRAQFFYKTLKLCIRPMFLNLAGTLAIAGLLSSYTGFELALRLLLLTMMCVIRQGSEVGIFYHTVKSGWTGVAAVMHISMVSLLAD